MMQPKDFIDSAVDLLTQVQAANDALKALKKQGEEENLDVVSLMLVAKATLNDKLQELQEKHDNLGKVLEQM